MANIAVLTSGGDSPGMNAAIRAVVRCAIYNGHTATGIPYGYEGLLAGEFIPLGVHDVADQIQRGGTFLHTARTEAMKTDAGIDLAAENLGKCGADALVVIGGDGSYKGALALSKKGVNVVGIPGTIDNDIPSSDYSIGFDTALNTAIEAIGKIRDTSFSNERVDVIEVMGRGSGNIALYSGIAGGAEVIVVPEMPYDIQAIREKVLRGKGRRKLHSILVFAEGAGNLEVFCKELSEGAGVELRATRLGYIQRGGSPSAFDRLLASRMGAHAVEAILSGKRNRAVGLCANRYTDLDLEEALAMKYQLDEKAYSVAMQLSI